MKILFICGSLEPGRDGVGDYVRRLSAELIGQGHVIGAAAINDRNATELFEHQGQASELTILRLPASADEGQRFSQLKEFIGNFNPGWLSLQFVSFSFHPKGLVFGLAKKLAVAAGGRPWHIMFHEIWVGMTDQSSKKELVWGMMQRELIRGLIKKLKPAVIHTHTDLYKKRLEGLGAEVSLLPLFSNIPVMFPEKIREKVKQGIQAADPVGIVIFGGIHGGAPVKELVEEAQQYAAEHHTTLELVIVGRNGREQENWVKEWIGTNLRLIQMGEQPAEKVSEILSAYDLGIFTTPIALVEKSGSVAAMREHGIHLLCVSQPWDPRKINLNENPFGILNYKKGNLATFLKSKPDFTYMPVLADIAGKLITDLKTDN